MKKKLLALLVATTVLTSLVGCGTKKTPSDNNTNNPTNEATQTPTETPDAGNVEPEDVTLKIWAPANQIETGHIQSVVEMFKAANPQWNITETIETQGEDVAKDEILKDVTAAGDVYFFASDQLSELIGAGAISRLGGEAEALVNDTMEPVVAETVTKDGAVYAIPFTHNTFFMFYDKTLLTEEDIKSVESIVNKETADDVFNFQFDSAGGWKLGSWYYGAGNTIYGENGLDFAAGANWNNPTGVAVTNYLIDLINNKKVVFEAEHNIQELAESHRIGAWFDGSWNYNAYKDILGDDLGLAVLPTFNPDGNDYQLKGFYGSKAIGVNSHAAFPQVAVAFATFLGSEEIQLKRFTETAQIPTNIVASANEAVKSDPVAAVIVKEVEVAAVMQPTSGEFNSRYWSNVGALAGEIRTGDLNKDNVQQKLDTFVSTLAVE